MVLIRQCQYFDLVTKINFFLCQVPHFPKSNLEPWKEVRTIGLTIYISREMFKLFTKMWVLSDGEVSTIDPINKGFAP